MLAGRVTAGGPNRNAGCESDGTALALDLYQRHGQRILRVCRDHLAGWLAAPAVEAEDAAQEPFLRALAGVALLNNPFGRFRTWLERLGRSTASGRPVLVAILLSALALSTAGSHVQRQPLTGRGIVAQPSSSAHLAAAPTTWLGFVD